VPTAPSFKGDIHKKYHFTDEETEVQGSTITCQDQGIGEAGMQTFSPHMALL
jgi:hypothetical protein